MHQEINNSRHQQGLCSAFRLVKSPLRTLYKRISLKLTLLKNVSCTPNLKIWLRACFCQNFVCN